jgi:hypothetical protein
MSLTTYCDFSEVRSALGVNEIELSDGVLGLPVYEMGLIRELNRLSTSLNAAFLAIHLLTPSARTSTEAELHDAVRLFSVYAAAKQVGVSLANFAPKDVGDGKATISRYAGEPFEKVLSGIEDYYSALRGELRSLYETFSSSSSIAVASTKPSKFFVAAKRGYDPVTGA